MPPKKTTKTTVIERVTTVKETRVETKSEPKTTKPKYGACYRCGRTSHWAPDCYAKTTTDGDELSDSE